MSSVPTWLERTLKSAVLTRLRGLEFGALTIVDGGERHDFGGGLHGATEPSATVIVHDPAFWPALALQGSVGAGATYVNGVWDADDLAQLVRVFVRNRDVLNGLERGLARLSAPVLRFLHARNENTRTGARRNIVAHYDLGNDFFAEFLDPTMTYSCGLFERGDETLEQAQRAKIDRLCRKLALRRGDSLLEIGTGWGAFAIHAAKHYGCKVTTTTISPAQYEIARERIAREGLESRITLLLEDYRDLTGRFDRVVSVEMIEAVGARFHPDFFRTLMDRLDVDGIAAIQAITIQDQEFERARRSVDFIQRYIFPGSCIPSVTALLDAATRASDLRLFHLEDFGPHYATTLAAWNERMHARRESILALGYDAKLLRLFEFYFKYCEGGFAERAIGLAQLVFTRPGCKRAPILGSLASRGAPLESAVSAGA
ncbi:MAG: class I SAM-dependent methyltransferase [Planctomycetes bacterium]|nr:class I SAM-dependent methyltransferase [Planctomycetota bacterium]MCC7170522.1 class I SAM-dependent methyltransferase [Planctomycetota bacterium]